MRPLRRVHPGTLAALDGLIAVLEEPSRIDRGFAQHLIGQIDALLHDIGYPRRSGSAQPRRAAVAADEIAVLPPASL